MTVVLLDTNMLLAPHQHGVDVLSEIMRILPGARVATLSSVVLELKGIALGSSDDAVAARVGLRLIEDRGLEVLPSGGLADDGLLERAVGGCMVATNDGGLKARLQKAGAGVVTMRGKNHLARI